MGPSLLDESRRVALVGGEESLRALARAARCLKAGKRSTHPELILFDSWGELQEYAEYAPSGRDLMPLVDLVDEHGVDVILSALDRLAAERGAEIVVSTAHKAKGREWASVRIGEDFTEPADQEEPDENGDPLPGDIDDAEARLAYVAVTRARHQLDLGGLSWINQHPTAPPVTSVHPSTQDHPRPGTCWAPRRTDNQSIAYGRSSWRGAPNKGPYRAHCASFTPHERSNSAWFRWPWPLSCMSFPASQVIHFVLMLTGACRSEASSTRRLLLSVAASLPSTPGNTDDDRSPGRTRSSA